MAARRRAIQAVAANGRAAITDADLIILAAPIREVSRTVPYILKAAPPAALVLDVAGTKTAIVKQAARVLAKTRTAAFVAGHPMAGSEKSGPNHAAADLFRERPFALYAPPQHDRAGALRKATAIVRRLGARPLVVDPATHDRLVATTSALPQLASVALALTLANEGLSQAVKLAGPGLQGALRLAASPYRIWRHGLSSNKSNVRGALAHFDKHVRRLMKAIAAGDDRFLARSFERAASIKRELDRSIGRRRKNP